MEVGTFTQRPEVGDERGEGEGGVGQSAPQRVGGMWWGPAAPPGPSRASSRSSDIGWPAAAAPMNGNSDQLPCQERILIRHDHDYYKSFSAHQILWY